MEGRRMTRRNKINQKKKVHDMEYDAVIKSHKLDMRRTWNRNG
jgi:hypothetical protein